MRSRSSSSRSSSSRSSSSRSSSSRSSSSRSSSSRSSSSKYSDLSITQLRNLCAKRNIPECIGDEIRKLKKNEIIELLKIHGDKNLFKTENLHSDDIKPEYKYYIDRPLRYHYMNDIDIHIRPYTKYDESEEIYSSMNFDDLKKEINNPAFIFNFNKSIKNLLEYKSTIYGILASKTEAMIKNMKEEKNRTNDDSKIHLINSSTKFLENIRDIIEIIQTRTKNLSLENTEKRLKLAIMDPQKGLSSIVGRKDVKNMIASQLYAFSKNYKTFISSFNNICLFGSAGTGKTVIAKVLSFVYSKCGILIKDKFMIATRTELVGQYIGDTAPKTRDVLMHTLEGILFIDEAYQLANPDSERDFGQESVTEIVNFLDKYIGMNIVIVAGYEDKMKNQFFGSNEGLFRRFPYQIVLKNYSVKELTQILLIFMQQKLGYALDDAVCDYIYTIMEIINKEAPIVFKYQAGDALNLGTSIVRSINSSYRIVWEPNNLSNNIIIINEGINEFLKMKGFILQ